jgi:hypothetical protein
MRSFDQTASGYGRSYCASLFVLSLGVELAHSFTPNCQQLSELENMIQPGRLLRKMPARRFSPLVVHWR